MVLRIPLAFLIFFKHASLLCGLSHNRRFYSLYSLVVYFSAALNTSVYPSKLNLCTTFPADQLPTVYFHIHKSTPLKFCNELIKLCILIKNPRLLRFCQFYVSLYHFSTTLLPQLFNIRGVNTYNLGTHSESH